MSKKIMNLHPYWIIYFREGVMGPAVLTTAIEPIFVIAMNNSLHISQAGDDHQEELIHLKLEGLLPANQELVINPVLRTATLLSHVPDGKAEMVVQQHFSPNGLRVLVPLLRAYPEMCLNEVLFANLFSLPLDQAYQQMREMRALTIRSVHRAISTLRVKLRVFGWGIGSIRGEGYLLRPLIKAQG